MVGAGGSGIVSKLVKDQPEAKVVVWDVPLRVWHWLFAISVLTALSTGLIAELGSIELHQYAGISVVSLLVFRFIWGVIGSPYARWSCYKTTPRKFVNHFLGKGTPNPHTAPGIVLVVVLMLAATAQGITGLFMTDDIFFEGPFYDYINEDAASWLEVIHRNVWRIVLIAVCVHLLAHLIYGLILRDATPLSMVTGKKAVKLPPTTTPKLRALCSLVVGSAVFAGLILLAD